MSNFIPNLSYADEMLEEIGLTSLEDLFADVPENLRGELRIDGPKSEMEVMRELRELAGKNRRANMSFIGGGIAEHYIPAAVSYLISRSEFLTAYTPYQPEASQGSLQAMFEYQSYISELYDMDVVNASLYDMATALGEACLMCYRISGGNKFIIPTAISEAKKAVLRNYVRGFGIMVEEVGYDERGMLNLEDLKCAVDKDTIGVYVETPNMLGVLEEEIKQVRDLAPLLVVGANPLALPLIKPPGEYGADMAIGGFSSSLSFGGPMLGVFAAKKEYMRQMPGRIIGLTKDDGGRRSFCMILQTREQHIRRARATSNICTNEGLLAIASAIYFALMGGEGMKRVAAKNLENVMSLSKRVGEMFKVPFEGSTFFGEFPFMHDGMMGLRDRVFERGIEFGPVLTGDTALIATTEMHTTREHDALIEALMEEKNV